MAEQLALVLAPIKVVRAMPTSQQRMLGFLVAHPDWYAARRDADWDTALALKNRGYLFMVHATEPDLRRPSRLVPVTRLSATPEGEAFARAAGLGCPGRSTGECDLCAAIAGREPLARAKGER